MKPKARFKWGVIPYRILASGKIEVIIISTRKGNWSLPKGNLVKEIGPRRTAQLEAYEEAGIEGILHPCRMTCSLNHTCIYLYPLAVTKVFEDWPESKRRKRKWISLAKGSRILSRKEMRKVLRNFLPPKT